MSNDNDLRTASTSDWISSSDILMPLFFWHSEIKCCTTSSIYRSCFTFDAAKVLLFFDICKTCLHFFQSFSINQRSFCLVLSLRPGYPIFLSYFCLALSALFALLDICVQQKYLTISDQVHRVNNSNMINDYFLHPKSRQ